MNPEFVQDKANIYYLEAAMSTIEQTVIDYSDRQQDVEPSSDIQSQLVNVTTTISHCSAFGYLCTKFGLSLFECHILLLCLAQALLPYFAQLCAQAEGDERLAYPTFGLAMRLFPDSHWSAFLPTAPLQHWQLVQVGASQELIKCRLQIDNSILLYLLGQPYQDERLIHLIQPLPKIDSNLPLQPSHQNIAQKLAAIWSPVETASTLPVVQLCGAEVSDKYAIANTACQLVKRSLKIIPARNLPTDPTELNNFIRRWERQVALTNNVLLLDCQQLNLAEPSLNTAILQLIENIHSPLIISTEDRLHSPRRPLMNFDVVKLTPEEQQNIWHTFLGNTATELNGHLKALVSQFNLNTHAIQSACLQIKNQPIPSKNSLLSHDLWDICRTMARPQLEDLAQHINATASWNDLILPELQKKILRDLIAQVRQRGKVYWEWGFASKGSRGLGVSALFAGAPGTGKTMAAEVIAKELRLDLYRIDLSAVISKYIGETEKNLRRIFDAAEAGGAILLFDEADALFGKRSDVKDSHDRHANVEVSYLLQRMEAYQGLAILTTNLKHSLDQAFMRRLRFVISFPFPDFKSRVEIWRCIFPPQIPTHNLEFDKLAQLNLAGGNIRNIALNATFNAADAGESVMMKHLLNAARSEYLKLEKTLTDSEIKGWL